jgi:hypothetical protein
MLSHRVVGQFEIVAQTAGDNRIGQGPKVHGLKHHVTVSNTQLGLGGEHRVLSVCAGLLAFDERPQSRLISPKCATVVICGAQ